MKYLANTVPGCDTQSGLSVISDFINTNINTKDVSDQLSKSELLQTKKNRTGSIKIMDGAGSQMTARFSHLKPNSSNFNNSQIIPNQSFCRSQRSTSHHKPKSKNSARENIK